MKKRTKVVLSIVLIVVLASLAFAGFMVVARNNQEKTYNAVIEDIDLSTLADGGYTGSCSAFPVTAEVDVVVEDHAIVSIDLVKHLNGQGEEAEIIPKLVVDAQSLMVDTVSGATYSSKVILIAIENALLSAAGE